MNQKTTKAKTPEKKPRANPTRTGFYRWTVEIEVHKTWVEDGFDLTPDNIHERMWKMVPHAYAHEIRARVVDAPPRKALMVERGESPTRRRRAK